MKHSDGVPLAEAVPGPRACPLGPLQPSPWASAWSSRNANEQSLNIPAGEYQGWGARSI